MRMPKSQEALTTKRVRFTYMEEDGVGSIDFQFRGLKYHIWEFEDDGSFGAETNIRFAGKSEDITGDYDQIIADEILGWPEMVITD